MAPVAVPDTISWTRSPIAAPWLASSRRPYRPVAGRGSASAEAGHGAQRVGRGAAEAEVLEVQGYLLEQHVGADLRPAAARLCGAQQRRLRLLHHHFADERLGSQAGRVERQRVVRVHAERRRVDDDVVSGGIIEAEA